MTVSVRFCMVLDHLMIRRPPCCCVMKSPRVSCLVTSKECTGCGKILDSLRNEKKHVRYKALNTKGLSIMLDCWIMACNMSIQIKGWVLGFNCAEIWMDLRKRGETFISKWLSGKAMDNVKSPQGM